MPKRGRFIFIYLYKPLFVESSIYSESGGNKFLFSTISQFFFFLLLTIAERDEASSRDRVDRTRGRIARIRLANEWQQFTDSLGRGGRRNGRFRFSRALRPIDSEKLGISSGPLSSVRPFYVNASVTLEFQERRKDSVTPLIFTRDNFPISRPVHPFRSIQLARHWSNPASIVIKFP